MSEIDKLLIGLDDLAEGRVRIILPTVKRKLSRKRELAVLQEKHPVFTLCLVARCKDILGCWDVSEYKFMDSPSRFFSCPRIQKIEKRGIVYFPNYYHLVRHGKTLTGFSDMELALLLLALREYIKAHPSILSRNVQAKELLGKLDFVSDIVLVGELKQR